MIGASAASSSCPQSTSRPAVRLPQHQRRQQQQRQRAVGARRLCAAASGAAAGGGGEQPPALDTSYVGAQPAAGMDPKVAEALAKVQAALSDAEDNMQRLHELPSAQLPSKWTPVLAVVRTIAQFAALTAICVAAHSFSLAARVLVSLAVGLGAAWYGWRRSSLSPSGALASVLVGWGTLGASFRCGLLLLTFFVTSSKITQLGEELKDVEEGHKKGGQRDWRQVCCNALVPTGLALAAAYFSGSMSAAGGADLALGQAPAGGASVALARLLTALHAAFLGYYACCCGDTWSSELGQLRCGGSLLVVACPWCAC